MLSQTMKSCVLALACGLAGAGAAYAYVDNFDPPKKDKDKEKPVMTGGGEMPAQVRASADKFFGGASFQCKTILEDGETYFECRGVKDSVPQVILLTDQGSTFEVRTASSVDKLPAEALVDFKKQYPDSKITQVLGVERHYYEVEFNKGGEQQRVRLLANGHQWRHEDRGPTQREKDKDKAKS